MTTSTAGPRTGVDAVVADRRRGFLRGTAGLAGELLVTAGVLVLLFVAWQLWGTGLATARAQHSLSDELEQRWSTTNRGASGPAAGTGSTAPGSGVTGTGSGGTGSGGTGPAGSVAAVDPGPPLAAPAEGDALARLVIPAMDLDLVVVQGTELADLARGPGHYPASVMPGQVGNFAVAGHRTTHGAPFFRIAELHAGDPVVVQTATRVFTYRVSSHEVVAPDDVAVVAPVPDSPGTAPTAAVLTLTSCNPKYSARQRWVVHARLASVQAR